MVRVHSWLSGLDASSNLTGVDQLTLMSSVKAYGCCTNGCGGVLFAAILATFSNMRGSIALKYCLCDVRYVAV